MTNTATFPMGPYHPALPQPIGLTFKLRGERIVGMEPPVTGFCHRDVESLVIGQEPEQALRVVERVCSLSGHSYRTALARALEAATGAAPSPRAEIVREVFGEVERALGRLWLLAQVARDANIHAAQRDALEAREGFYDALLETTGERHYWGVSQVGGVRDLDAPDLQPLANAFDQFSATLDAWRVAVSARGALGRLGAELGRLTADQVRERKVASVATRATGISGDLRRDAPYGGYAAAKVEWPESDQGAYKGDMTARCAVAVDDLATSVQLVNALLQALPNAATAAGTRGGANSATKAGSAKLEAPHGVVEVFAGTTADGKVAGFRLDTPGGGTVDMLFTALEGQPVSASAVIIASLDLCVECLDH